MGTESDIQGYVTERLVAGESKEELRRRLVEVGWSEDKANNLVGLAVKSSAKSNVKKILIVLVLLFLVIGGGGYLVWAQKKVNIKQSSGEIFVEPTVEIASNLTIEDIRGELTKLLRVDELEFTDEVRSTVGNCILKATYTGRKKGVREYQVSEGGPVMGAGCVETGFVSTYAETYWLNEGIYFRQYSDKPLSRYEEGSNIAIGSRPTEYLKAIVEKPEDLVLVQFGKEGDLAKVELKRQVGEAGTMSLYLGTGARITKIDYDVTRTESGLTGEMKGEMSVKWQTADINLPN